MENSSLHTFKIEPICSQGALIHRIYLDGVPLKGVQKAKISLSVDAVPTVRLDIISDNIVIENMQAKGSLSEVLAGEVEVMKKLVELLPSCTSSV